MREEIALDSLTTDLESCRKIAQEKESLLIGLKYLQGGV